MSVSTNSSTIIRNTYINNYLVSGWYSPVIDIIDDALQLPMSPTSGDRYAISDSLVIAEFDGTQWNSGVVIDAGRFAVINDDRSVYYRNDNIFDTETAAGVEIITGEVFIPRESWTGTSHNYYAEVVFSGVTESSVIIVAPYVERSNINNVSTYHVYASGQKQDVISFAGFASFMPPSGVRFNVIVENFS